MLRGRAQPPRKRLHSHAGFFKFRVGAFRFHVDVFTFDIGVSRFPLGVFTFQVGVFTFQVDVFTFQVGVFTLHVGLFTFHVNVFTFHVRPICIDIFAKWVKFRRFFSEKRQFGMRRLDGAWDCVRTASGSDRINEARRVN